MTVTMRSRCRRWIFMYIVLLFILLVAQTDKANEPLWNTYLIGWDSIAPWKLRETTYIPQCTNEERVNYLQQQCGDTKKLIVDETNSSPKGLFFFRITLVDVQHKLLICAPPKSGCTTWKTILANNSLTQPLAPRYNVDDLHRGSLLCEKYGICFLTSYNRSMQQHILDNYYKIMVARNPLDRIQSAYVSKVMSDADPVMKKKLLANIAANFVKHNESLQSGRDVNLHDFITNVKFSQSDRLNHMNAHWAPMCNMCLPCRINYDQVLKTETMDNDNFNVISSRLGPHFRGIGTKFNQEENDDKKASLSTSGRLLHLFQNVSISNLDFLEDYYKADFKLFGYARELSRVDDKISIYSACTNGSLQRKCC